MQKLECERTIKFGDIKKRARAREEFCSFNQDRALSRRQPDLSLPPALENDDGISMSGELVAHEFFRTEETKHYRTAALAQ